MEPVPLDTMRPWRLALRTGRGSWEGHMGTIRRLSEISYQDHMRCDEGILARFV